MADERRTQAELLNIFRDFQGENDISEQDLRDLCLSTSRGDGWIFLIDGTRDSLANAQVIPAATRNQILCDGSGVLSNISQIRALPADIWDTSTSEMKPVLNDSYLVRAGFKLQTTIASGDHFMEIDLDIGASQPIFQETRALLKGAGVQHAMSFTIPIFAAALFVANFGQIMVQSDVEVSVWDVNLFIGRNFNEDG